MQGEIDSKTKVTVLRGTEELELEVTRAEFEITSIYHHMIGKIGYLQITRFNSKTTEQLKAAVEEMQGQGATALLFDLRDCGGGLLDATADILDYLLPKGDIISAKYKNGTIDVMFTSDENEIEMPMAVLTNSGSASASELFAAAVRDYNKGILIGTNTFGKGVMQTTQPLSDGSSIKFTFAEFLPPSGVSFNGVGLAPDIRVELSGDEQKYFSQLTDNNDPQIKAAIEYFSK